MRNFAGQTIHRQQHSCIVPPLLPSPIDQGCPSSGTGPAPCPDAAGSQPAAGCTSICQQARQTSLDQTASSRKPAGSPATPSSIPDWLLQRGRGAEKQAADSRQRQATPARSQRGSGSFQQPGEVRTIKSCRVKQGKGRPSCPVRLWIPAQKDGKSVLVRARQGLPVAALPMG